MYDFFWFMHELFGSFQKISLIEFNMKISLSFLMVLMLTTTFSKDLKILRFYVNDA
jgi:hypothetical protein